MLKHALVIVGLCLSLTLSPQAASRGTQAIQLSNVLRVYEEHELISDEPKFIIGNSHMEYIPKLIQAARKRGVEVVFATELKMDGLRSGEVLWGFYDEEDNTIYLNAFLEPNAILATLFHELGHALAPKELREAENGQVFAEALSILSCNLLKLNIYYSSFGYLQRFPERHEVIIRYSKILDALSNELVSEVR